MGKAIIFAASKQGSHKDRQLGPKTPSKNIIQYAGGVLESVPNTLDTFKNWIRSARGMDFEEEDLSYYKAEIERIMNKS